MSGLEFGECPEWDFPVSKQNVSPTTLEEGDSAVGDPESPDPESLSHLMLLVIGSMNPFHRTKDKALIHGSSAQGV